MSRTLQQHFLALEEVLLSLQPLWQAQPFKQSRPLWCETNPQLTEALLQLADAELASLREDDLRLHQWLSAYLPQFAQLPELLRLPVQQTEVRSAPSHLDWAIPGRKWQQILRFAESVESTARPLLEWCGGKGHLGRLLASRWQQPVTTLERDTGLCAAGSDLAQRARVQQSFQPIDVFSPLSPDLHPYHTVALHACGELHRTLVRKAVAEQAPALDIAPCCYHLYGEECYQAFTATARLQLSRDDLRLAVTETVTSKPREVARRDREMAWKLGFLQLYADLSGDRDYRALAPIDKQWLNDGFESFCQRMALREGIQVLSSTSLDFDAYEQHGWRRQAEVMRLSLMRHALRRVLELWLVLDMAIYLQQQGYQVRLSTFCETVLTPRNILLSARREDYSAVEH